MPYANPSLLKGKGRRPGETMATQYVVLFGRVLQKGRDNPYSSYQTLARWVNRTNERDIRTHLCKQFCWSDMNAPEVKKWLSNVLCGFRVLQLVFPEPHVGRGDFQQPPSSDEDDDE